MKKYFRIFVCLCVALLAANCFFLNEAIKYINQQLSELERTVGDNCKELECIRNQFIDDGQ